MYTNLDVQALSADVTGSKNASIFRETASVRIGKINDTQNNSVNVYGHKGYACVGTHTANGANGGIRI